MSNGITGEEIDERRAHVRPLLDWACAGGPQDERHPHYAAVTEGRDPADPKYSSCGDLAHWLLFRLGCRQPWINRAEHKGWRVGRNVSALAFEAPTSVRRTPHAGSIFDTGDVLIVWNRADGTDAHVMVVHEFDVSALRAGAPRLVVGEFGQPGGHVKERPLLLRGDDLYVGARQVQRWLPLHIVLTDAAERGLLAPVSLPWVTQ